MRNNNKKWFTIIELLIATTMSIALLMWVYQIARLFKEVKSDVAYTQSMEKALSKINTSFEDTIYNSSEIYYADYTRCEWRFDWNISLVNDMLSSAWINDEFVEDSTKNIWFCWDDWQFSMIWLVKTDRLWYDSYYIWKFTWMKLEEISPIDKYSKAYRDSDWWTLTNLDKFMMWTNVWEWNIWIIDFEIYYDWRDLTTNYLENLNISAPKVKVSFIMEIVINKEKRFKKFDRTFIF